MYDICPLLIAEEILKDVHERKTLVARYILINFYNKINFNKDIAIK